MTTRDELIFDVWKEQKWHTVEPHLKITSQLVSLVLFDRLWLFYTKYQILLSRAPFIILKTKYYLSWVHFVNMWFILVCVVWHFLYYVVKSCVYIYFEQGISQSLLLHVLNIFIVSHKICVLFKVNFTMLLL